jgi:hypothetical protein
MFSSKSLLLFLVLLKKILKYLDCTFFTYYEVDCLK